MKVTLLEFPTEQDWIECKRRALITIYGKGLGEIKPPTSDWKYKILKARHSPIRYLRYSFLIEDIPSNTSVHLCRHIHSQPYVSSLRNDRQDTMDGDKAPRDTPVNMIYDVNAEELIVVANKRLCNMASDKTRAVVDLMCRAVGKVTPEIKPLLVPMCEWLHGCPEMKSCGRYSVWEK
jgi:hypothetical protein